VRKDRQTAVIAGVVGHRSYKYITERVFIFMVDYEKRKQQYLAEAEKLFDELYVPKNQDYGDSFDKLLDEMGLASFAVRAYDKILRLVSLVGKDAAVKDESADDTVRDLANYSLMYLRWQRDRGEGRTDGDVDRARRRRILGM